MRRLKKRILAHTFPTLSIAALLCAVPVSRAAAPQSHGAPVSQRRLAELDHGPWITANGRVDPALLKELKKRAGPIRCAKPRFYAKNVNLGKTASGSLIIVQGPTCYCSATGNCPLWIFRKTVRGYKELGVADNVQNFSVAKTKTKGLPDIVLSSTEGAFWSLLSLARFDGKRYRSAGCYNLSYMYRDRDGVLREHKKPKITHCSK